jgi:type III restriction enzyme
VAWCERINTLPAELRSGRPWHYALLGEERVIEWQGQGARLADLLAATRLAPAVDRLAQGLLL